MIPEEEEARRTGTPREGERDALAASAEHRARRAWLGDAALLRRAEAAEASVQGLEERLADLRARQVEIERERESATAQLAERELELRRVKQREHAEQQLRVEAEEAAVRARRGQRAELERWQRRAEQAQAAAQHAERQRDALAARLAAVDESCERLQTGIAALQSVATALGATFEHEHRASRTRIRELERALECARAPERQEPVADGAQRREEMAEALAAAVARLRTRAAVAEQTQAGRQVGQPKIEPSQASGLSQAGPSPVGQSWTGGPSPVGEAQAGQPPTREPAAAQSPAAIAPPATDAERHAPEVPTVIVVPRLFAPRGHAARRLAPVVRRLARRLAKWADHTQDDARQPPAVRRSRT